MNASKRKVGNLFKNMKNLIIKYGYTVKVARSKSKPVGEKKRGLYYTGHWTFY